MSVQPSPDAHVSGNHSEPAVATHSRRQPDGTHMSTWVPVNEEPAFTPRKIRVVCVGAGYSGLIIAYKYKYLMNMTDFVDLTIYEKNSDIGGTWLENKYPGVACDVPAHIYTFSWEPNPDWSTFYASGPEIWQYMKRTTEKYGLDERVQFHTKVIETIWDDGAGKWKIKVQRGESIVNDEADVLINGAGILKHVTAMDINGLDSFKGKLLHSASWDPSIDWAGKRVAIIGNGSSAIQILSEMQKTAAKLTTYIRSPTWVAANFGSQFARNGKNFAYSDEEKRRFREHPEELFKLRKEIEHSFNKFFRTLLNDSPEQAAAYSYFKQLMEERLNHDPELCAKLIPDWQVGCRRISPGDGYLEALQEKNVNCNFSPIAKITKTGVQTLEDEEEFDIIVCATGFDVSFSPFWKLVGRNGTLLANEWEDVPEAYFGICAPDQPNYFVFNGPNCPIAHGSLLAVMESTAEWILRWCRKIASENIKSICVKREVLEEYNTYIQEFMKRTVWVGGCRSWFKNGKVDGRVTAMYAGSIIHYKGKGMKPIKITTLYIDFVPEMLDNFRTEDFDFEYRSVNRFIFMGNGSTIREAKDEDLAFYVYK